MVPGLFPGGVPGIFSDVSPSERTMALGSTESLVKMSTRNIPGGKSYRCVGLTTSPPSRSEFHEIWEPKLPGTLWVSPGLLRDCFSFYLLCTKSWNVEQLQNDFNIPRSVSVCPFISEDAKCAFCTAVPEKDESRWNRSVKTRQGWKGSRGSEQQRRLSLRADVRELRRWEPTAEDGS
jgi:hypothetical protein